MSETIYQHYDCLRFHLTVYSHQVYFILGHLKAAEVTNY